jgi:hypothetical protein
MRSLFITFAVLLAILTLISTLGGSLNHETFIEEPLPFEQPSSHHFWKDQQKALVESFLESKEAESSNGFNFVAEHNQENFASCGNYKEDFVDEPEQEPTQYQYQEQAQEPAQEPTQDIEPFEDEKTYGAF